jgi:hypothetical protein
LTADVEFRTTIPVVALMKVRFLMIVAMVVDKLTVRTVFAPPPERKVVAVSRPERVMLLLFKEKFPV